MLEEKVYDLEDRLIEFQFLQWKLQKHCHVRTQVNIYLDK